MRVMCARLALLLALSFVPRFASAHEPGLRFEWHAPQGCPSRAAVIEQAEKLLGRSLTVVAPVELALEAHVTRPGESWQLDVLQRSSTGTRARSVKAGSCQELADATALFMALAVDPSLGASGAASAAFPAEQQAEASTPASEAEAVPAPAAASASAEPRAVPARPPVADRPPRVHAGLSVALTAGRLPGKAFASVLHAGVSRRSWLWLAELGFHPERQASVAGSRAGGDLSMLGLSTGAGYLLDLEPMAVGPVAGVEIGWLRGTGTGVQNPTRAGVLLLSAHAGARYALTLSREWALTAAGAVSALANRPRFVLDGIGPVYQPERWGWRLGVGAEWRSP